MKTVFSGIQPSGNLHIGNYIGAINQWIKIQEEREAFFCIVDLHAITVPQDPRVLRDKILEVAGLYIACGLDPKKVHIFVQSQNPDHANLAWFLNCITPLGQLERMTQFKEKTEKHEANAGLFDYPVLMAADILLYQTDEVPVGEDQKQHIELTRDLAERFNKKYGQVFKIPSPVIRGETARIMSLQNPNSKMSKSDKDPMGTVNLLDTESDIREKIKRAVTDSRDGISENPTQSINNLLIVYSVFKNQNLNVSINELKGKTYGEFKNLLADLLITTLKPIQEKYKEIRSDQDNLIKILEEGLSYAKGISSQTLRKVQERLGLI